MWLRWNVASLVLVWRFEDLIDLLIDAAMHHAFWRLPPPPPLAAHMQLLAQSINQRSSQSHTRAKEKPHPSTTTRGANPASRSDAGLGGCERVATAL